MNTPAPVVEIDGSEFSTLEEFYRHFAVRALDGSSWGMNLDAFNDVLRGGLGTPEGGFTLNWRNHQLSRTRLGYSETVRQLEIRLLRCHPDNRQYVQADLEEAKQGRGVTVFDWLVEIISVHGIGGEESEDNVELQLN